MFRRIRTQGPLLLASSVILGLLISSFAVAAGVSNPLSGGKRNPSANPSQAYSSETEIIANTSTYGTRQSNKSDNGGGAIYGCRSQAGGSEQGMEPCIRANNLANGRAFEFEGNGTEVGRIVNENVNGAPFTTNAKGVATGLNADQVDGKNVQDIQADALKAATDAANARTKFAVVSADGVLGANRGVTATSRVSAGTYTVAFADDISACALSATESQFENAGAVGVALGDDKKTVTLLGEAGEASRGALAKPRAGRSFAAGVGPGGPNPRRGRDGGGLVRGAGEASRGAFVSLRVGEASRGALVSLRVSARGAEPAG
jgi:hypothetical protein